MEKEFLADLRTQVEQTNGLTPENNALRQRLIAFLKENLLHLLKNDFEELLNLMYRLDVSEAKFHEAMQPNDLEKVADQLAEIVLEREVKRLEFRNKYNSGANE